MLSDSKIWNKTYSYHKSSPWDKSFSRPDKCKICTPALDLGPGFRVKLNRILFQYLNWKGLHDFGEQRQII